jgi:hypothetical protein
MFMEKRIDVIKRAREIVKNPTLLYMGERAIYIALFVGTFLLLAFLVLPNLMLFKYQKEGEISRSLYKAPKDFYIIDEPATLKKKKEAEERVLPIYTLDLGQSPSLVEKVSDLFSKIEEIKDDEKLSKEQKEREVVKELSEILSKKEAEVLAKATRSRLVSIEEDTKRMMNICFEKGIYDDEKESIDDKMKKGITIEVISPKRPKEIRVVKTKDAIFTTSQIKNLSARRLKLSLPPYTELDEIAWKIARAHLKPNLKFNEKKTRQRIKEERAKVEPVKITVRKGEKIVGEGEMVDRIAEAKFRALARMKKRANLTIAAGFSFLLLLCMVSVILYLLRYQKEIASANKKLLALGLIVVVIMVIARVLISYFPSWAIYLLPTSAASLLIAFLLSERFAIFVTFILSLLLGIMVEWRLDLVLLFFFSGLFAIYLLPVARMRGEVFKIGVAIAAVNAVILLAFQLINQEPVTLKSKPLLGLANGIIVYWVVIGALPLFENILLLTTNFRLFELSDLNTPLLRDLFFEAPGTYHHSLLVGSLAETAAAEVGANPLLARVASYYHDVGKIINPQYFSENQKDRNIHQEINPSLSVTVLKSHIQRGVDIAKAKRLPEEITNIIQQHHGTSVISYFYQQAKERGEDPHLPDYHYTGPKPQTKEAAIVMLADATEAASRTLEKPSPARIENLVKELIEEKFIAGELNECDLTLKDLTKIASSFIHILISLFHARVEYPKEKNDKG